MAIDGTRGNGNFSECSHIGEEGHKTTIGSVYQYGSPTKIDSSHSVPEGIKANKKRI
jgi:hypothetical protein